jgi:hypothetical protein
MYDLIEYPEYEDMTEAEPNYDFSELDEDEAPDYLPLLYEKPKPRRKQNPKAEVEEGIGSGTLLLALVGFGAWAWWDKNKSGGTWFWQRLGIGIGRQALLPTRLTPQPASEYKTVTIISPRRDFTQEDVCLVMP